MDLQALYEQVKESIDRVDLQKIWPGFSPLKFALYDPENCFFDGRYIEKTDAFCANTSIRFRGEQIAIWMVSGEPDVIVLASKLIHEMFHGFQTLRGWDSWSDEMDALFNYRYDPENLSLKLRENELLCALLCRFDADSFRELLGIRKYRSEAFPYEFSYESKVEEIEGTANYVEWQVLRQLDPDKASALTDEMRGMLTKPERLFPIRISSYQSGALMIHALLSAGLYTFDPGERPAILPVLREAAFPDDGRLAGRAHLREATEAAETFRERTAEIIRSALSGNEVVLTGPLELAGINVYNARCYDGYLTSTYFLMYRENEENKLLQGDFVIRMKDQKTIDTVYRWK